MKKLPESVLVKNQKKTFSKNIMFEGRERKMTVTIRHDDECGNGHNTFSITGQIGNDMCGCIHDEISEHFPELAKYVKWHLCSTDEPMHYVSNTMYHASDKDCWGLRKGEKRQITNGRTGKLVWQLARVVDGEHKRATVEGIPSNIDSDEKPECEVEGLEYVPWCRVGEGKEPNLEAARSCAIWPNATLEQLQSEEVLLSRLPEIMQNFKRDVEELGFTY